MFQSDTFDSCGGGTQSALRRLTMLEAGYLEAARRHRSLIEDLVGTLCRMRNSVQAGGDLSVDIVTLGDCLGEHAARARKVLAELDEVLAVVQVQQHRHLGTS
jgi:hypothetical protein